MELKDICATEKNSGHTHTLDDSNNGNTSVPIGSSAGHSHDYEINQDGSVSVMESNGHTHEVVKENNKGNGIEHKQIHFEIKQIQDEDPEFFTFEGYASTFGNVDRGDDIIESGAFTKSLGKFMPKLLWQHQMSQPLGVFTEIIETDRGLYVKGKMPKSDDLVRGRVMPQMKVGSIDSMSIGYSITNEENKRCDDKVIRSIKEVNLFEISLVTMPMNEQATVTAMKSIKPFESLPLPEDKKEWTIQDIVKACAALKGAKGGIEIEESKKDECVKDINEFFASKELPNPLEKGFAPLIDTFDRLKEISALIKSYGLSNEESNSLIHAIKRISDKEKTENDELAQNWKELLSTAKKYV